MDEEMVLQIMINMNSSDIFLVIYYVSSDVNTKMGK